MVQRDCMVYSPKSSYIHHCCVWNNKVKLFRTNKRPPHLRFCYTRKDFRSVARSVEVKLYSPTDLPNLE